MATLQRPFALWLLPEPGARGLLQGLIQGLTQHAGTPPFPPHVTLYGGSRGPGEDLGPALAAAARAAGPLTLRVLGLGHDASFFHCVFLDLERAPGLEGMASAFRGGLRLVAPYTLAPHLSLLYAELSTARREMILERISVPLAEVRFDTLALAEPGNFAEGWKDVRSWRRLAARPLSG